MNNIIISIMQRCAKQAKDKSDIAKHAVIVALIATVKRELRKANEPH